MKRSSRNILFVVIGLIAIVLITSPKISLFRSAPEILSAEGSTDARLPVSIYVVKPQILEDRIQATGTVLANEEVELKSEISGKIEQILFQEGSRVQKGQLLVKINDDELQAQREKLESQKNLSQERLARRKVLFEKQGISPEDFEVTTNEFNAVLAEININLSRIEKSEIRAPFNGSIGLRYVSPGSYLTSDTKIATLQNLDRMKIDFSIPEKYVSRVSKGFKIQFTIPSTDKVYGGTVYAIEPRIDPVTRTVQLRAKAENLDGSITPGSFAHVNLVLKQLPDALTVPTEALIPELGGQKVYVLRNGVVTEQTVETGIRMEHVIQITKGLAPNDTVVTSGLLQLRPGLPVRILDSAIGGNTQ